MKSKVPREQLGHDQIDSRVIIETGVLPHVARRMASDLSIEKNLRNLAEQFGTARSLKACIAIDIQFHHALVEASGLQPASSDYS